MSKQFVKISRSFGFNRNRLIYWEFYNDEQVVLTFEGDIEATLDDSDARTFRNWVETEAEEAPETYQHTLYGRSQDAQDLRPNSAQRRGK